MATYANEADVKLTLGKIGTGTRLADAGVNVAQMIPAAHAEVLDKLVEVYGPTLPTIAPASDAFEAARWAEARICAANILDILRASLGDESDIPERLRRSAWDTLARGLPGMRPGDSPVDGGTVTWSGQPRIGSSMPVSNFPDPYDELALPVYGVTW